MISEQIKESIELAGRTLTLETGLLAPRATGSVKATYGETVLLATAVISEPRDDIDFFPLSIEYEERLYAGGLIKGSPWVKREGRPRDEAILCGRMIDRAIRPLFPNDFKNDVQIIITVLSVDEDNDPSIIGMVAAAAALHIAGAPWIGPVSGVRVGMVEGSYIINPLTTTEKEYSKMDMVVASTKEKTVMLEVGAEEITEEEAIKGIEFGFNENLRLIEMIETLAEKAGRKVIEYDTPEVDEELMDRIKTFIKENFDFHANESKDKAESSAERDEFLDTLFAQFEGKTTKSVMVGVFDKMRKSEIRRLILEEGKRLDNRAMDQVRDLFVDVSLLPRTHGSALFQRGDTQALTVTTLGSTSLEQLIESMSGEETKRYIHHYNFPPYSTGETGRVGSPKRREIGHGALAEKALEPMIPSEEQFPYTIRVVSEILSSNGSSSMASVCGSTLSLMDAGVPIKAPVAGVAMGLVSDGDKNIVLTDLMGEEDMAGDMDFKVAGTKDGITAVQVDVKNDGLSLALITEIFEKAKAGRLFIMDAMMKVIDAPRTQLSQYAPKVVSLKIDPEKIGEVIGPGGKVIKAIQADTNTVIEIQEDGTVHISGVQQEGLDNAKKRIEGITHVPEVGEIYDGTVKRIVDFGAFVEFLPGKEGLVHISEIDNNYVEKVRDFLNEGDQVKIKIIEIDDRGRVNLSIKALMQDGTTE
ncbi:polyribonucleotide nucleotidyltransferase [candidate division WWE3 bacterium]|uniref:Polyribonucleotide nucleotidyltransferase n=1 Tax=candidate division WWE3 bacterium TaxID=2053526 RepID=A0A955RQ47_UNCKA|nr:polyribonucleotide nucleotidyltransferase [candidate division WWE3 bacterium]